MDAPKCRLCGHRHWKPEGHVYVTKTVTVMDVAPEVTKTVTVSSHPVTPFVTEADMIAAAVSPEHECPICGLLHKKPMSGAERTRAYRERRHGA